MRSRENKKHINFTLERLLNFLRTIDKDDRYGIKIIYIIDGY